MTDQGGDKTRYTRLRELVAEFADADLSDAHKLAALQKRARGFLTSARDASARNQKAVEWRKREMERQDVEIAPIIRKMRAEKLSLRQIADRLHGMKIWSRRGTYWHSSSIALIMKRNGID